jgi:hypothetical protein
MKEGLARCIQIPDENDTSDYAPSEVSAGIIDAVIAFPGISGNLRTPAVAPNLPFPIDYCISVRR